VALLPQVLGLRCESKGENAILKASRLNHLEILKFLMHLVIKKMIPNDIAFTVDSLTSRNILHNAVINKERDLIEFIITQIDGDKGELRGTKDYKGKYPKDHD